MKFLEHPSKTDQQRADAMRIERDRQTQVLLNAINAAISETGKTLGPAPMLNALAGALACAQAAMLCSVPPGKTRKALSEAMEKTRRRAVAEYDGKVAHSQVVNIGQLS